MGEGFKNKKIIILTSYDFIESRKQKNQVFNISNVEGSKLSKHVMVSAGVCVTVVRACCTSSQTAKVNAKLYVETLLPRLIEDRKSVLPSGFIFQQNAWCICSHGKVGSRLYCHQLQ